MSFEKRSVTSSLIFKFPNDDESQRPQLALFRRSNKVRTYQGKWGLVSGSIEPTDGSPLACAWRELREETRLTSAALTLLRHGKPFTFQDASVGREWTIYPFMFKLKEASAADITIDWEHIGYRWVDPDEVSDEPRFEGVPRLMQSLRSVWFDIDLGERAGRILASGLRELRGDFESGAREMAARAAGIYRETVEALDEADGEAWWRNVRLAGWHLWKNGRESMGASIANLVLAVLGVVEGTVCDAAAAGDALGECARRAIDEVSRSREDSGRRIQESFRSVVMRGGVDVDESQGRAMRILTLSSSSTVTACLVDALATVTSATKGHRTFDIRVLESRPLFEGVKTARLLAAHARRAASIPPAAPAAPAAAPAAASEAAHSATTTNSSPISRITVYTDASAAIAAQGVHLVLLGADAIDGSANVSNKTGSLPAVLAARHVSPGVKVVVVSETAKVLPFDRPDEERSNVREMTSSWGHNGDVGVDVGVDADADADADAANVGDDGVKVENVLFEWVDAALVDVFVTERGVLTGEEMKGMAEEIRRGADRFFVDI